MNPLHEYFSAETLNRTNSTSAPFFDNNNNRNRSSTNTYNNNKAAVNPAVAAALPVPSAPSTVIPYPSLSSLSIPSNSAPIKASASSSSLPSSCTTPAAMSNSSSTSATVSSYLNPTTSMNNPTSTNYSNVNNSSSNNNGMTTTPIPIPSLLLKPLAIRAGILRRPDFFIQKRVGDMNLVEEEDLLYGALRFASSSAQIPSRLCPPITTAETSTTTTTSSSSSVFQKDLIESISEDVGLQPVQCLPISLHDYCKGENFRILLTVGSVASYSVREVQFEVFMISPKKERSLICKQDVGVLPSQDTFTRPVSTPLRETGKYTVEVKARCVDPAGHLREVTWNTTIPVQAGVIEEWGGTPSAGEGSGRAPSTGGELGERGIQKKDGQEGGSAAIANAVAYRVPTPFFFKDSMTYKDLSALWDHRAGEVYELEVFIKNSTTSFVSLTSCFLELHSRSPCKVLSASSAPGMPRTNKEGNKKEEEEEEEESDDGEDAEVVMNGGSGGSSNHWSWESAISDRQRYSGAIQGNFFSHMKYKRASTGSGGERSGEISPSCSTPLPAETVETFLAPGERERFTFLVFIPYQALRHVSIKNVGSQQLGVITSSTTELGVLRWSWERHKGDSGASCSGRIWMNGLTAPPNVQPHLLSMRLPPLSLPLSPPPLSPSLPSTCVFACAGYPTLSASPIPIPRVGEWVTLAGVVVVIHPRGLTAQLGARSAGEEVGLVHHRHEGEGNRKSKTAVSVHPHWIGGGEEERREREGEDKDNLLLHRPPSMIDHLFSSSLDSSPPQKKPHSGSSPSPSSPPLSTIPPVVLSSLLVKVRPETFIPDWMYEGPTLLPLPAEHWHCSVVEPPLNRPSLSSSFPPQYSRTILPPHTTLNSAEEVWVAPFSLSLLPSRAGELTIPSGAVEIVSAVNPQQALWPEGQPQWKQDPDFTSLLSTITGQSCVVVRMEKQYNKCAGSITGNIAQEPMALITVL